MNSSNESHEFDPWNYIFKGSAKILSSDLLIIQSTFRDFIADKVQWMGIEFQVWLWSRPQLLGIFLGMAKNLGIVNCGKSLESLLELAVDIIDLYLNNPYHNSGHAFDVAFMVYYMLDDLGVAGQLSLMQSEKIALFIGALAHDMGHPGLNNTYQINSHTELAHKYNNKSVLENHSIDLLYDLLDKNPYLNIMFVNDAEIIDQIRNLFKIIILNTDMTYHFETEKKLVAILEFQPDIQKEEIDEPGDAEFTHNSTIHDDSIHSFFSQSFVSTLDQLSVLKNVKTENLESRNLLISSILHAAGILNLELMLDISNPARPFLVSKIWSGMVMEEFFLQGDREKADNLPISPSMDREVTDGGDVAAGFTSLIVQPFFDLLSVIFPRMDCFSVLLRDNAQRREVNAEPSPFQPVREELIGQNKSDFQKPSNTPQNTGRKVSMAAGMIEIENNLISSIAGRILYKRKHPEDSSSGSRRESSRRSTQNSYKMIEEE